MLGVTAILGKKVQVTTIGGVAVCMHTNTNKHTVFEFQVLSPVLKVETKWKGGENPLKAEVV